MRASELKALLRHIQEYRSLYEHHGVDTVTGPDGTAWSLWDLEYLLDEARRRLAKQQVTAIQLCVVEGLTEREASIRMGIAAGNPVMIYVNHGLQRLVGLMDSGELPRFLPDHRRHEDIQADRREAALQRVATKILAKVAVETNDCWIFPLSDPHVEPVVRIRASGTPTGYVGVHPRYLLYEARVGKVPPHHALVHVRAPYYFRGCVNPAHAVPREEKPHAVALRSARSDRAGGRRDHPTIAHRADVPGRQGGHPHSLERGESARGGDLHGVGRS